MRARHLRLVGESGPCRNHPETWETLDALEGDLVAVASQVIDTRTGDPLEPVSDLMMGFGSSFTILNRTSVDQRLAGRGLGRWLVGEAINVLSADSQFAALYPAPLDGRDGDARTASIDALTRVWASLGFQSVGGNVMVLDTSSIDWIDTLNDLRARFGAQQHDYA